MNIILISEIIICLILLFLAKWVQDRFTTFDDDHELFKVDNTALGISKAGYYLSVFIALCGLFLGVGLGNWIEVRDFAVYGFLCLALINVATYTTDLMILKNFKIYDQICGKQCEAVAWALAGSYIGSACILKGAVSGDDEPLANGILEIVIFFILGQIVLIGTAKAYQWIMPDLHDHLESGNVASGLSFAGYLIAVGIILGEQGSGNMTLSSETLGEYVLYSAISLLLLTVIRKYGFRFMFAAGESLLKEIEVDENQAAGWITALCSIGLALLLSKALA